MSLLLANSYSLTLKRHECRRFGYNLTFERTSRRASQGINQMGLFGTERVSKGLAQEVIGMVEAYYEHRGLNHKQYEIEGSEGCGWWLMEGSAKIYIFVQESNSGALIRITSPLVYIPNKDVEKFYRHLLDLNTNLTNCALSTHENVVLLVAQRPTVGLTQAELEELVWNNAYVADMLDNKLADQFSTQLYTHAVAKA